MSSSDDQWILEYEDTPLRFVVKGVAPDGLEVKDLVFVFHAADGFYSSEKIHLLQMGVNNKLARVPAPPNFFRILLLPENININAHPIFSINNGVLSVTLPKLLPPAGLHCVVEKEELKKEDEDEEDDDDSQEDEDDDDSEEELLSPGLDCCVKKEG